MGVGPQPLETGVHLKSERVRLGQHLELRNVLTRSGLFKSLFLYARVPFPKQSNRVAEFVDMALSQHRFWCTCGPTGSAGFGQLLYQP
jgi:hypothetical protein